MITLDKNLKHQQNLKEFRIKIILLKAKDNKPRTIERYLPKIKIILKSLNQNYIEIN
jgi:hypothetical protein